MALLALMNMEKQRKHINTNKMSTQPPIKSAQKNESKHRDTCAKNRSKRKKRRS